MGDRLRYATRACAASLLLAHEARGDAVTSETLAEASGRSTRPIVAAAVIEDGESMAELLRECLREQEPDVIQEVSVILFAWSASSR